jgi:hypothetical protein
MMFRKTGVAALGAAASLIALAGCSTSANTPAASTGTSSASGGAVSSTTAAGTGGGGTGETSASVLAGSIVKMATENSVTITGSTSGGTAGTDSQLSGVYQGQPTEFSMNVVTTGGTNAGTTSVVYDGSNFYLKVPELAAMAGGKPWVEFTSASLSSGLGTSFAPMIDNLKNNTGGVQLQALLASGTLQNLGSDTVNGTQATHYSGTIDDSQIAEISSVNGLTPAQVQQVKQLFQAGGVTSETIDLWIAPSGLPVQVKVAAVSTVLGTTTDTTDFSDWGAPVTITVPPAGQVGTLNIPTG